MSYKVTKFTFLIAVRKTRIKEGGGKYYSKVGAFFGVTFQPLILCGL